jgi:hypothetical protein
VDDDMRESLIIDLRAAIAAALHRPAADIGHIIVLAEVPGSAAMLHSLETEQAAQDTLMRLARMPAPILAPEVN